MRPQHIIILMASLSKTHTNKSELHMCVYVCLWPHTVNSQLHSMRFNQFLQNTCMLNAMMLVMVDCRSVDGVDCIGSVLLLNTDLQSDLQGDLGNVCNASQGNCLL